mmetsp:Transcript_6580/g.20878  ORF Transcript_6580/g.20878 Transcript_6580/m.20878 type:complete len:267 (-) Transcript_6580:166-966(-)
MPPDSTTSSSWCTHASSNSTSPPTDASALPPLPRTGNQPRRGFSCDPASPTVSRTSPRKSFRPTSSSSTVSTSSSSADCEGKRKRSCQTGVNVSFFSCVLPFTLPSFRKMTGSGLPTRSLLSSPRACSTVTTSTLGGPTATGGAGAAPEPAPEPASAPTSSPLRSSPPSAPTSAAPASAALAGAAAAAAAGTSPRHSNVSRSSPRTVFIPGSGWMRYHVDTLPRPNSVFNATLTCPSGSSRSRSLSYIFTTSISPFTPPLLPNRCL